MINFINNNQEIPFLRIYQEYIKALDNNQKNTEAILVSSFNPKKNEVDSRYVNLKYIDNNKFIFFTNYDSPKSIDFNLHNQIAACIYWQSINLQIRLKASIKKTDRKFNDKYFKKRSVEKNALAISSNQSKPIKSYSAVKKKYSDVIAKENLLKCPKYWGGYSFIPYEIEFWRGESFRLNRRDFYKLIDGKWKHNTLEP